MTDFDHTHLDEVLHSSRLRLAVMAVLSAVESAEFSFLRDITKTVDGTLLIQLRKLEEAGYITSAKRMIRRWRVTDYALTPKGREALIAYVDRLNELISRSTAENST